MHLMLVTAALSGALVSGAPAEAPPRGWNSYDSFTWFVNETQFLANCEYMSKNLLQYGFEYCVVDYKWYQTSDGQQWLLDDFCRPLPDPERWPSSREGKGFRPLADKVHAMGLKFGIHIMRGTSTFAAKKDCPIKGAESGSTVSRVSGAACPWCGESLSVNVSDPAGVLFYRSLYQQYAVDWQVDFIKNDCVFGNQFVPQEILAQADAIEHVAALPGARQLTYSLSPGSGTPSDLVSKSAQVAGRVNMYRVTGDDWDSWDDIEPSHFDVAAAMSDAGRIGASGLSGGRSWPDLDMLPLGWITSPGDEHHAPYRNSSLTLDEQRTQMTLWAMAKSPLMFGGDLRRLDTEPEVAALLTNTEVLEIDARSTHNAQIRKTSHQRVWQARLQVDGKPTRFYAAVFNTGAADTQTQLILSDFGTSATTCNATDVWSGASLGAVTAAAPLEIRVPSHGVRLAKCV